MSKKHKLDMIGRWAKENEISKWMMFHPEETYKKKDFQQKSYNNKKRNNKYDN
jgi:hypothetical protein